MTFVHPVLLGGLLFVGIPVLLHLLMRQKPKHLLFPAVRFLLQRRRTNQRRLQLRHLLLLALRMLLLACICLALARPKVFSDRLNLAGGDRPVAAVLIFDTSPSMEYKAGGKTRLDEARRRGLELLADFPEGSRVAVLDTADQGSDWLQNPSLVRERIGALQLRPVSYPVTQQLAQAYGMLAKLQQEQSDPNEALLPFIYVFSDRQQAAWDARQAENLKRLAERVSAPPVNAVFVDVGVEKPEDLAVADVELPRQIVPVGQKAEVRATLRATGRDYDTEVICRIDGQEVGRKPLKLAAGQSRVLTFEQHRATGGLHQVEVALRSSDAALEFNDKRFATFEVRGHRRALVITDDVPNADIWKITLELGGAFDAKVITPQTVATLSPNNLGEYQVVCLMSVARPPADLWEKLQKYVERGGGLAVIPGGEGMEADDSKLAYNEAKAAVGLLPGKLVQVARPPEKLPAHWEEAGFNHPAIAPFKEWGQQGNIDFNAPGLKPAAFRYWHVEPREALVVVSYDVPQHHPALLERKFDKAVKGRVLLYTVPLDDLHSAPPQRRARWHDYLETSFYVVLAHQTVGYLAGDLDEGRFNFQSGQTVPVPLAAGQLKSSYTVQHPSLSAAESIVARPENETELRLTRAVVPGNYTVADEEGQRVGGFSLNVAPEESVLARVPVEQIEDVLGPGSVLPLDFKTDLRDALSQRWSQPVELFPWLMLVLLFLLAVENLLANRFYRREDVAAAPVSVDSPSPPFHLG